MALCQLFFLSTIIKVATFILHQLFKFYLIFLLKLYYYFTVRASQKTKYSSPAGFLFTSQETAKLHSNKADFPSNKSSLNNFLISGTYFSNCSFSFVFRKLRVCLAAYLMGPPTELHTFSWTHGQIPMFLNCESKIILFFS